MIIQRLQLFIQHNHRRIQILIPNHFHVITTTELQIQIFVDPHPNRDPKTLKSWTRLGPDPFLFYQYLAPSVYINEERTKILAIYWLLSNISITTIRYRRVDYTFFAIFFVYVFEMTS
jgi:hypothetical protein